MDTLIQALLKLIFIAIPLLFGLFTYKYETLEFFRSMLLYSMVIAFDYGLKYNNAIKFKNIGIILHIALLMLFVSSLILSAISLIGVFNYNYAMEHWKRYFDILKPYIYWGIFLQIIWYGIEWVLLAVSEMLGCHTPKIQIKVSHPTDTAYGI